MIGTDIKALDGKLRSDRRNMIAFYKERRKLPFGAGSCSHAIKEKNHEQKASSVNDPRWLRIE